MGGDVQVKTAEPVTAQGVGATLKDDDGGSEGRHARLDDLAEEPGVILVVDAVVEGHVEGMMGARVQRVFGPRRSDGSCAREEVISIVLVEGQGHDSIGRPECLFDAVAVMDVDVDVENSWVDPEQLENGQHDVVDVAKP